MTDRQREALLILEEFDGIRAREFAKKFWPDNDMHLRSCRGGNGNQRGKGGWLAAGSYLSKLNKSGLVRNDYNTKGFGLTEKGRQALKAKTEVSDGN